MPCRPARWPALVVATSLGVPLLAGVPAVAAGDAVAPVLSVPAYATFVVGSQISDTAFGPDRDGAYFPGTTMQQQFAWSATDAGSGICGYDVSAVYAGDDPTLLVDDALQTSLTYTTTDYDDQEGGGSFKVVGFDVVARDCSGNTAHGFVEARPVVTQEDGWTYGYPGVTLTYSGVWGSSTCGCWSADRTRKTTAKGAAVTITKNFREGESVALVMERAASRGAFTVYVDGVRKATVNTHAAATQHRTIVWARRMPAGVHSVRIVNKATKGHARIDLDAVLTGSESTGP